MMDPTLALPVDDELRQVFRRYLAGEISGHVAILQLLTETSLAEIERTFALLTDAAGDLENADSERLRELAELFTSNRERCAEISKGLETQPAFLSDAVSEAERIAHYSRLFDRLVGESPEASVAAYSLGRVDVLRRATAEIVDFLIAGRIISGDKRILQIGCGIGRMEKALSPLVLSAAGIDISPEMIATARERCRGLHNVDLQVTSGLDLSMFEDGSLDLVYAVDSFPYVVAVGNDLVDRYFAEAARVLVPGGEFLILNFSYRESIELDRADVAALAARHSFQVVSSGQKPFELWDGAAFHLRLKSS